MSKKISKHSLVAIPCYNEEATIGSVVLKAKQYVDEVIVVDDGSSDRSADVATYAGAKVITHNGNKGYGTVIQSCFKYARENNFEILTTIDGDGQHDANLIPSVMKPVEDGIADISIGSRFLDGTKNNIPFYRKFGISVLTRITNLGSKKKYKIKDGQSGFRCYSRKAIEILDLKDHEMGVSAEILLEARKNDLNFQEVPIHCRYDLEGSTKKPIGHGLGVILSILQYMEIKHSLLFFGVPGLILFLSGLSLGLKVYFDYLTNGLLAVGLALITIALCVLGLLAGMTGLILHAVINAQRRK